MNIKKHPTFIIVMALLIIVILAILKSIRPSIDAIFETRDQIEKDRSKISILTEKEKLLTSANQDELSLQSQKLDEAIPSAINLPLILATLENIAKDAEVNVGSFSLSSSAAAVTLVPVVQGEKLSVFRFKVDLSGSFEKMEDFINRLGVVSPLIRFDSIAFTQDKAEAVLLSYFQPAVLSKIKSDAVLFGLNPDDKETLDEIFALSGPVLAQPESSSPSATETRESPFR